MPVLECSCGMVMSVSAAKPRNTCIRCGGAEFRELECFQPVVAATADESLAPITTCGIVLSMRLLPSIGQAANPIVASLYSMSRM